MAEMDFHGQTMFIHDPQPSALIEKKKDRRREVDLEVPHRRVESGPAGVAVPGAVRDPVRCHRLLRPGLFAAAAGRQFLISPSIDPLSDKNKDLTTREIDAAMDGMGIPRDKPIITQVSRFDYMKDPVGVIRAFELVRRSIDCRLVLIGGGAADDPEGEKVLSQVRRVANGRPDIHIISGQARSDIEINALQRASAVILQKSLREGFALTVSEALWKSRPVVASAVGGIPLQVKHKLTGLLAHGIDGVAYAVRQLLANPEYARWLGENGKEHVRHNFLITRHVRDYMVLFLALDHSEDVIHL